MVLYNFKKIQVVPSADQFVDIVLSKTQRQTPTIIHPNYAISRIRSFYMRKVKYTQQSFHDKLSKILEDFPRLDDIHPFYSDLMNVLYDRDHYKLALGQLNTALRLIDNLGSDYIRMLKYGDSLYRCKQLKRAALGRMCTLMKKQKASLAYLEQVRQHLSRLPSIDPYMRTLIISGYPNVGKSSFMNKITRADVDVQPYAFTTKSLLVGHCDYNYLRWQILDTPGILDKPLEERNTIEMQSVTALAHLQAAILYFIDISCQCGYTIQKQIQLFQNIKPLFVDKPLIVVLTKVDVIQRADLEMDDLAALEHLEKQLGSTLLEMSSLIDKGVMDVRNSACDRLLALRVEKRAASHRMDSVLNRLHVAEPIPRDDKIREATIPEAVLIKRKEKAEKAAKEKAKKEKEKDEFFSTVEIEEKDESSEEDPDWDPTAVQPDWRDQYMLKEEEWKYDPIPEIMDGMNVADFIDPDILARLDDLEKEEDQAMRELSEKEKLNLFAVEDADMAAIKRFRERRKASRLGTLLKKSSNKGFMPKKIITEKQPMGISNFEEHLVSLGLDPSKAVSRLRSKSRERSKSRKRSESRAKRDADGDLEMEAGAERGRKRVRETEALRKRSSSRGRSLLVQKGDGFKDASEKAKLLRREKRESKVRFLAGQKGPGDRTIGASKPRHLNSGKRGFQADRR